MTYTELIAWLCQQVVDVRALFADKGGVKPDLPIYAVTNDLMTALRAYKRAVLCAPPGAGKTTAIPLEMLKILELRGRILMLEPRRLATRAAAERMAQILGEPVGQTIGYRIKGESKSSHKTKIEVVTEGILTRMIQSDGELSGISAVIFDEFHERSLHADLGLALCLEISDALRKDLLLLVMSATLETDPISNLMGNAPIIRAQGRSFPVTPIWLDQPLAKTAQFDSTFGELILRALDEKKGGLLAFLPGEREIHSVASYLTSRLSKECKLQLLYGALPFAKQRIAIAPMKEGRKIVLATSIAETSLTIEDIRIVVDSGKARRSEFDAASGMSRLVTEKVSKHEAEQRMGRAGRVAEGACFKFWAKAEEGSLHTASPPEIANADLSSLALELALWSVKPEDLAFLTPPDTARYSEAVTLLISLGALDIDDKITPHGKAIASLPLHPRLGHMLITAGSPAITLSALLNEQDPLTRSAPCDLTLRLDLIKNAQDFVKRHSFSYHSNVLGRIKQEIARLRQMANHIKSDLSPAQMVALAYPDRIGKRRLGESPRYLLSSGKGAMFLSPDALGQASFIVATRMDGKQKEAGIRQAISITKNEIRQLFGNQIKSDRRCEWSRRDGRVMARCEEKLGAVALSNRVWKDVPKETVARALLKGIREIGLCLNTSAQLFLARLAVAGAPYDEITQHHLTDTLEDWILPYISGLKSTQDWKSFDKLPALQSLLNWAESQRLDEIAPAAFTTPLGRKILINYGSDYPEISLKLQEMFGQTAHPMIGKTPLRVILLSPAGRPLQTTTDIPTFWITSYLDVRKDMRGRYPRHPWPENPAEANPTLKTNRRKA
ncbi:MAG: ATP-dependent helicase HrpB [Paracoccaceae bacterium]|nr:ATP-dependent helicase HrpB [Paracoccaceae bacterium]